MGPSGCPRSQPSNDPATATAWAFGAHTAKLVPPSPGCAPNRRCRNRWVPSLKRYRSSSVALAAAPVVSSGVAEVPSSGLMESGFMSGSFPGSRGAVARLGRRAPRRSAGRGGAPRGQVRRDRAGCGGGSHRSGRRGRPARGRRRSRRVGRAFRRPRRPNSTRSRARVRRRGAGGISVVSLLATRSASGSMSWVRMPATVRAGMRVSGSSSMWNCSSYIPSTSHRSKASDTSAGTVPRSSPTIVSSAAAADAAITASISSRGYCT